MSECGVLIANRHQPRIEQLDKFLLRNAKFVDANRQRLPIRLEPSNGGVVESVVAAAKQSKYDLFHLIGRIGNVSARSTFIAEFLKCTLDLHALRQEIFSSLGVEQLHVLQSGVKAKISVQIIQ